MINICEVCKLEFETTKEAKTCSSKCRKDLSRINSVTHDVTLVARNVTLDFKFYIISKTNGLDRTEDEKSKTRIAKYWYEVPLAAIPVIQKDWPPMPIYMNGRQYFLWWKNEFDTKNGEPIILNPFPVRDNVKYEMGGEGSRKWGA